MSFFRGSSQPRDWTHISCVSCTAGRLYRLSHYTGSVFEKSGKCSFSHAVCPWLLMLSTKIPAYHEAFLGNLSPHFKDPIYTSQNKRLYFMEASTLHALVKVSIYTCESVICSKQKNELYCHMPQVPRNLTFSDLFPSYDQTLRVLSFTPSKGTSRHVLWLTEGTKRLIMSSYHSKTKARVKIQLWRR